MRHANLLIADGERGVRQVLATLLRESGFTVIGEAENGGQALSLTRALRPDAVLLDLLLPNLSGIEVARTLKGERLAPVVALTEGGAASVEVIERANSAGILGFLSKPVRGQDLGPVIAIAITRFHEFVALENEIKSLNERMEARKVVGRAKAILMERHSLPERDAFRRIQQQSISLNKPVHEIAKAIITASEIPT